MKYDISKSVKGRACEVQVDPAGMIRYQSHQRSQVRAARAEASWVISADCDKRQK